MVSSIIFDWKRTLYDPDKRALIRGARALLSFFKEKDIPLVLIGKDNNDQMERELQRLKIEGFFKSIIFTKNNKKEKDFLYFVSKQSPQNTFIIGDRIKSEIKIGNKLNATTVWVKKGKFEKEKPLNKNQEPDITVSSLKELKILFGELLLNK